MRQCLVRSCFIVLMFVLGNSLFAGPDEEGCRDVLKWRPVDFEHLSTELPKFFGMAEGLTSEGVVLSGRVSMKRSRIALDGSEVFLKEMSSAPATLELIFRFENIAPFGAGVYLFDSSILEVNTARAFGQLKFGMSRYVELNEKISPYVDLLEKEIGPISELSKRLPPNHVDYRFVEEALSRGRVLVTDRGLLIEVIQGNKLSKVIFFKDESGKVSRAEALVRIIEPDDDLSRGSVFRFEFSF